MTQTSVSADPTDLLGEVIASYLHAIDSQQPLDREVLLARYPDLADELSAFFANLDGFEQVARPARSLLGAGADSPTSGTMVWEDTSTSGVAAVTSRDQPLPRLCDHEILEEIARGGMGVVYRARQVSLNRVVALKMILASRLASPLEVQRFRQEAEAVAQLDHPHIVPIYEVGEHEGQPFFSMKLIEGGSLSMHLPRLRQDLRAGVTLLAQVARAVHFAHQHGILHRDLKPANILLERPTEEGGEWVPYVSDFGLAKRVERIPGQDGELTRTGAIVGTPGYMAPEQATGQGKLTTAADTYALGTVLYECLTGRPPFQGNTPLDTLCQVIQDEPRSPRALNPQTSRDLETVCLKCLHKEPDKRYGSAAELADDLERWLAGEPVRARRIGPVLRTLKWMRRRPAVAALSALLVLVAMTGFGGVLWQLDQTERARKQAATKAVDAEQARQLALQEAKAKEKARQLALAERDEKEQARQKAESARLALSQALERTEQVLYVNRIGQAYREWQAGNAGRSMQLLDLCRPQDRNWEWHFIDRLCHQEEYSIPSNRRGRYNAVAFSPDGKLLAATGGRGGVSLQSASTGKWLANLFSPDSAPIVSLAFGPDSRMLAGAHGRRIGGGEQPGQIVVWDVHSRKVIQTLPGCLWVTFSPDGSQLATINTVDQEREPRKICIYDTRTWKLVRGWAGHKSPLRCVSFSADGKKVLSLGRDDGLLTWDPTTGKQLAAVEASGQLAQQFAVSADGKWIAHASPGNVLTLRDAETGKVVLKCAGHSGSPRGLAFSPDGQWLASGSEDMSVKVWNAKTGQLAHTLRGHGHTVVGVAFSPDGKRLASASREPTVKVWDLTTPKEERVASIHPKSVRTFTFDHDGKRLASTDGNLVKVWKPDTGEVLFERTFTRAVRGLVFLPGDTGLLVAMNSGRVVRWRFRQKPSPLLNHGAILTKVVLNKTGSSLVTAGQEGTLQLWEPASGKPLRELKGHSMNLRSVAFTPNDRYIISLARDNLVRGEVIIHDTATGKVLRHYTFGTSPQQVAVSPDGTQLAMADADQVYIWDIRPGQVPDLAARPRLRLYSRANLSNSLSFSADGRRLAVSGSDQAVRLWDLTTGEQILTMRPHGEEVTHVAFSPVGGLLATGGSDGKVKVWDGRPRVVSKKGRR